MSIYMKSCSLIVLASSFLLNASAFGGEWTSGINVGGSFAGKTHSKVSYRSTIISDTTDKAGLGFDYAAYYTYHSDSPFGVRFEMDQTSYNNDGFANDLQTALIVMPRVEFGTTVKFWAGIGVGPQLTTMGKISDSNGTTSVSYDSANYLSLLFTPRVGVEIPVSDKYFISSEFGWNSISTTLSGTATSGTTTIILSDDRQRTWFNFTVGLGWKLGKDEKVSTTDTPPPQAYESNQSTPPPQAYETNRPAPTTQTYETSQPATHQQAEENVNLLLKLKTLKDSGAINEAEYQSEKKKILSK